MPWLDDRTAVLIVGPAGEGVHQGATGHLSLLDVKTGQLTELEPELSLYAQPAVAPDGSIVYPDIPSGQPHVWRSGKAKPLDVSDLQIGGVRPVGVINPALAPDGTKLVGVAGGDLGRHTHGYVVIDLTDSSSSIVHSVDPPDTDAVIPWGITWALTAGGWPRSRRRGTRWRTACGWVQPTPRRKSTSASGQTTRSGSTPPVSCS